MQFLNQIFGLAPLYSLLIAGYVFDAVVSFFFSLKLYQAYKRHKAELTGFYLQGLVLQVPLLIVSGFGFYFYPQFPQPINILTVLVVLFLYPSMAFHSQITTSLLGYGRKLAIGLILGAGALNLVGLGFAYINNSPFLANSILSIFSTPPIIFVYFVTGIIFIRRGIKRTSDFGKRKAIALGSGWILSTVSGIGLNLAVVFNSIFVTVASSILLAIAYAIVSIAFITSHHHEHKNEQKNA